MPATGSTETGSIMHLPIFWRYEKALENKAMVIGELGFEVGKESTDFVARAAIERALRELPAVRVGKTPHLSFDGGNRGQAYAKFVHPETDENGHGLRIAGDAPAHSGESVSLRAVNCQRDEAKQPGLRASTFGASLGGRDPSQRVLGEIVRANREEIRFLTKPRPSQPTGISP
jgi:hypothetical protein